MNDLGMDAGDDCGQPISSSPPSPDEPDDKRHFLHEHLFRAKLVCYSLLLIVGVSQIVLRENFPQIKLPWPVIGSVLIVVLLGIVFIPLIKHYLWHVSKKQ